VVPRRLAPGAGDAAVVTSTANPAVKEARKLARPHGRRASRTRSWEGPDEVLVEGPAVGEALPFLRRLFVSDDAAPDERALAADARAGGCEVLVATRAVVGSIAQTVAPQALVGVASLPRVGLEDALAPASLVVVAWQVRDPGNLGAILRCADVAGADAVILTADSVDPANPKVVRASAGSLFHLPVVHDAAFADVVACCRRRGLRLVAASPRGAVDVAGVDLGGPVALVFGNEARGLGADVAAACDVLVRIPMSRRQRPGFHGTPESLNLAAAVAILTYEAARQRRAAHPR
jgi:RNA methyltransferase, TrmH family